MLTVFGQNFLQFSIADAIFAIPAGDPQDDILDEVTTFEYIHTAYIVLNNMGKL